MDGDGMVEVVAMGNVYDCSVGHPPGKYNGVYLFHADRSCFVSGAYDWRSPPVDTGAPLSEAYSVIENVQPPKQPSLSCGLLPSDSCGSRHCR